MVASNRAGRAGAGRTEWLEQARAYLRDADPVLAGLITGRTGLRPAPLDD